MLDMALRLMQNIARRMVYLFPDVFFRIWGASEKNVRHILLEDTQGVTVSESPNVVDPIFCNILRDTPRSRDCHFWNERTMQVVYLSSLFDARTASSVATGHLKPRTMDWESFFLVLLKHSERTIDR